MPECFEVKRMAQYLSDAGIEGQTISHMKWQNLGYRMLKFTKRHNTKASIKDACIYANTLASQVNNQKILQIKTKAKYTFLELSKGVLEWHYRFTGIAKLENKSFDGYLETIFSLPIAHNNPNHLRCQIKLEHNSILYYDTRCLSSWLYYPNITLEQCPRIHSLPKDLTQVCPKDSETFYNSLINCKKDLKTHLLDQTLLPSGIGNYLACEICAFAKLNPWKKTNSLNKIEQKRLFKSLLEITILAVNRSDYAWFSVFNRKTCANCKQATLKQKHKQGAQSTHWCQHCQT